MSTEPETPPHILTFLERLDAEQTVWTRVQRARNRLLGGTPAAPTSPTEIVVGRNEIALLRELGKWPIPARDKLHKTMTLLEPFLESTYGLDVIEVDADDFLRLY